MSRRFALAALLLSWLGTRAALAADAPPPTLQPFSASYTWSWHGMVVAVSHTRLQRLPDGHWLYSSTGEPRGIGHLYPVHPVITSLLSVTSDGVVPLHYKAQGGGAAQRDADVVFDWQHMRATGVYSGETVDLALKPAVQDDVSVQVAMMVELQRGHTPQQVLEIDRNTIRNYDYRRENSDVPLQTKLGTVQTTVYSSQHPGSPRITRFWCAPDRAFLPMRVEQTRNGNLEWSMEILSLQLGAPAQVLGKVTPF